MKIGSFSYLSIPLFPYRMLDQDSATVFPIGLTSPVPVITTRLIDTIYIIVEVRFIKKVKLIQG